MELYFSQQIFKKILIYQILWKSPELFQADRQTDTTKLIVAFRFANAPKNGILFWNVYIQEISY
jgi:hypothetical protein